MKMSLERVLDGRLAIAERRRVGIGGERSGKTFTAAGKKESITDINENLFVVEMDGGIAEIHCE